MAISKASPGQLQGKVLGVTPLAPLPHLTPLGQAPSKGAKKMNSGRRSQYSTVLKALTLLFLLYSH